MRALTRVVLFTVYVLYATMLTFLVASILTLFSNLVSSIARAEERVAVIDTGLDLTDPRFKRVLCSTGHKDFTGTGIRDTKGHGTHIAGLIKQYAGNADYCLIILKYYDENASGESNLSREGQALREALKLRATVVNISAGGPEFDEKEYLSIKSAPSVKFFVAAGNDNQSIDVPSQEFYPASYSLTNIFPVGALQNLGFEEKKLKSSNWGKRVRYWEVGEMVKSTAPTGMSYMSGTSMATAIAAGKYLAGELYEREAPKGYGCKSDSCEYQPHR